MGKFTSWVLEHSKQITAIILIFDLFFLFIMISRFSISTDLLSSFGKGFKANTDFEKISDKYKSGDMLILGIETNDILSKNNLEKTYEFTQSLKKITSISYIRSFLPEKYLKSLVFIDVNKSTIENDYLSIISFIKKINSDMFRKNSGLFFINISKNANLVKTIDSILSLSKSYGYKVHLSGNPVMNYYMYKYIIWIMLFIIPLIIVILLTIFDFAIGNFKAALLSILPAGMAALWTFGFIFLTADSLSIVTIIVPMFIIIMGSADGLHITSHFISESANGKNSRDAIIQAMDMVGLSVVLTTITTIFGFLSLTFTSLDFLRKMGFYTSVGIGFAGIISWTFLPLVLSHTSFKKMREKSVRNSILIKFFLSATKHRKTVIVVLLLFAVFFASFIPHLQVKSERSDLFKSYTSVVKDMNYFKDNYGFANTDVIDFRSNSTDLFNSQVKKQILDLETELYKIKGVEKVVSFMDVENNVKKNIDNQFMEELVIRRMIKENLFPLEQWVKANKDYKILLQLSSGNAETMKKIEKVISKHSNVVFTGPDYVFYKLNQEVIKDQIESLSTAIVMVFILMLLIYRNVFVAFKSILPILYTILLFFGFLRLSGFNLNIIVADVASIAIGIGIDYSIHFMGEYRYFKGNLEKTIENVGIPIIANATGLTLGLLALLLSPLKVHVYVSLSIAFTMIVSSLATMLMLPLFLKDSSK